MAKLNINQITSSSATNSALLQSLKIPTAVVATPSTSGLTLNWTDNNTHLGNKNTIVFIGSSTTAGTGASSYATCYVSLVTNWLNANYKNQSVTNLAIGGYTTYQLMPTGFVTSISNRPTVDTNRNITAALALTPNIIIMNIPTNDKANGYDDLEYFNNLTTIFNLAKDAGVKMYITTTQPRNLADADRADLQAIAAKMITYFGADRVIDFYNGHTNADNTVLNAYSYGDGVHQNDLGHADYALRVEAKIQSYIESAVSVTSKEVDIFNYSSGIWSANVVDRFATSFSVSGLTTGTTYGYQVSTKNLTYVATSKIGIATTLIPTATTVSGSTSGTTSTFTGSTRLLFDLGASNNTTPVTSGVTWNNLSDTQFTYTSTGATFITNPVNTGNTIINGFSATADKANASGGTFNTAGMNVQVGDYPATATADSIYFDAGQGIVSWTFVIPSGKAGSIKFWGSRNASDDTRHLQMKLSTDTVWQEMNAANNTDYNQAVTFTGLTGTTVIQSQVKSGSNYGYIGVIDVTLS